RSPAGEAVMRDVVESEGLSGQIQCDSAGTISFHTGNPPDHRMHAAAQNRDINTGGQARQINQADYNEFDLILTMDEDNYRNVLNMAPAGEYSAEIKRFCDFVTKSTANEVPDPYYGGAQGFETVLDLLEDGCASLLEHVREKLDR
ncbi:MAG: low molecular weight protein-tyrosine-phosphatase, partial [Verrucomicrobiota bacterium]|nr:low molecular weight protein-tyrosine-phosphatase [Verrucomicrobiota bacterium]